MFGGYRGIIFAAFLGLAIYAFQAGVGIGYLSQQSETYPAYKNSPGNQAGPQPASGVNVQTQEYKQPCREPEGHDESDLCAQWHAANNAGEAARWARWQFILSVFGVLGLGGTIALTIRATNAAVQSNAISRDTAHRQLRAYVAVDSNRIIPIGKALGGLPWSGKPGCVTFVFRNYGQTPATRFSTTLRIALSPYDEGCVKPKEWDYEVDFELLDIAPQAEAHRTTKFPESVVAARSGIEAGTVALFVEAETSYCDIFRSKHTQVTTFFSRGDRYKSGALNLALQYPESSTQSEAD